MSAVGWLSEIFPLLYVVLAIPAGRLLDRWFRPALAGGGILMAGGGVLRLGGDTFAWAMAGQVTVAVAQPVILSAVSKLAGDYLPAAERPAGIAVGSAGSFAGMFLALILGPTWAAMARSTVACRRGGARRRGCHRSGGALRRRALKQRECGDPGSAARALWALPAMRTLCGLVFVGFGIFVALATWLQTLLHPSGVSDQIAGALLVGMIVAGIVGCAVLPPIVASRGAERASCAAPFWSAALVARAWVAALARGARYRDRRNGLRLLPALPIILTVAEQLAGVAAGTAGALVWMAGNLGGLIVALIVQGLVHDPLPAFLAMAAVSLLGLTFVGRYPSAAEILAQGLRTSGSAEGAVEELAAF